MVHSNQKSRKHIWGTLIRHVDLRMFIAIIGRLGRVVGFTIIVQSPQVVLMLFFCYFDSTLKRNPCTELWSEAVEKYRRVGPPPTN
jgi:hypothetical protein